MAIECHHCAPMGPVRLRQIYFVITRRCNLFCEHCIRSSGPGIRDYLTAADAERALAKLSPFGQSALLLISGGEPALHPEFQEIVRSGAQLFPKVMVNTNGLLLGTLRAAVEQNPGLYLQISLDGDQEGHDRIRGAGTFTRTLQHIRVLADLGVRITIATTADRMNIDRLRLLDRSLADVPFALWSIKREVVYGRADPNQALTTDDWNRFVTCAQESFHTRSRLLVQPMFSLSSFHPDAAFPGADPDLRNCGTGRSKLYINPDLTVFPCACLEEMIVGNLATEPATAILERIGALPVEPATGSPCHLCPVKEPCMGGCPGASLRNYGKFGIGDPRCPAVAELVGEPTW